MGGVRLIASFGITLATALRTPLDGSLEDPLNR